MSPTRARRTMSSGITARRRRRVSMVGIVVALAGGPLFAALAPNTPVAAAEPAQISLVTQALDVGFGAPLSIVIGVPTTVDLLGPDTRLVVTAYDRVTSRDNLHLAIDGTLGRAVDSVDLIAADLPRDSANNLVISLPTETNTRTVAALQLPREGVYPIVVDVRVGEDNLAELRTFTRRLADPDSDSSNPAGSLQVAMAMSVTAPLQLDDGLATTSDPQATAELAELGAAVAATTATPATVRIAPRSLDLLDENALAQLAADLQGDELLSEPSLPIDPSLAGQDGHQDLATQWLRNGEDTLRDRLGLAASRSVRFATTPLSQPGAELLRDQGTRMVVMTRAVYDSLPERVSDLNFPQLSRVELPDGSRLDLALPDPEISALLDDPTDQPTLTAIRIGAELVTWRQELISAGFRPDRSGIIVARSDLGVPDPATIGAVSALIGNTTGLQGVTLDDFSVGVDPLLYDGQEIFAALPPTIPGALQPRIDLAGQLTIEAVEASSMLPANSPEIGQWSAYTTIMATSALSDAQVARTATRLRDEFTTIRTSLEVPESSRRFNLTGRSAVLKFPFRNTSAVPLTFVLFLDSTKLKAPVGGQTVVLEPGVHAVEIPVTARSNGEFGVTLRVVTPVGESLLSPPIPLTAKVNALSGLGNFATGALLLLVLLWWARSWRSTVRKRRAAPTLQRHPTSASATTDVPSNAEATTLPPS